MSSLNVRWSKLHETLLFRIIVKISFFFLIVQITR